MTPEMKAKLEEWEREAQYNLNALNKVVQPERYLIKWHERIITLSKTIRDLYLVIEKKDAALKKIRKVHSYPNEMDSGDTRLMNVHDVEEQVDIALAIKPAGTLGETK